VKVAASRSRQVLSVHLGIELHPDLAVVHRANGISDYVLYETGQTVGDEYEGVLPVWQGMLGCDVKGHRSDSAGFWEGWEQRRSSA
jgi:hypothetical protein